MSGGALALVGLLVVLAAAARWFRLAYHVALPEDRRGFIALFLVGMALGMWALGLGAGVPGTIAAVLAVGLSAFFLFTVAISAQKPGGDAITVGATLPDVSAPDENGAIVSLASFRGSPLLLKFFRGHW